MKKRGLSDIITTVLIILIVLAAVVVVWNVVKKTVSEKSGEIGTEKFSVSLSASVSNLSENPILISVSRNAGAGNITAIKIVLRNSQTSCTYTNNTLIPKELETVIYSIDTTKDCIITNPESYDVYPILNVNEKDVIGLKADIKGISINLDNYSKYVDNYKYTGYGISGLENFDELPYLKRGVQTLQFSSFGRNGLNWDDGFNGKYSCLNRKFGQPGNCVIFDEKGPGGIYMLRFTIRSGDVILPDLGVGNIQFYFDGETTPRIDVFVGNISLGGYPFISPLAGKTAGNYGKYSYVPIMFNKSLRIEATKQAYFYQITYQKYDSSYNIKSYDGTEDFNNLALIWSRKGQHPTGNEGSEIGAGGKTLSSGQTQILLDYSGDLNYISTLKLNMSPSSENDLENVWIRMYWDGELTVNSPIGEFFGSGLGEVDYSSLAVGMSKKSYYYSNWPMPFNNNAKIEIVNNASEQVFVNYIIKAKKDEEMIAGENAGYFHAEYSEEFPTSAQKDYKFIQKSGAGHMVGIMHTLRGSANSTDLKREGLPDFGGYYLSKFLEGDERFFIDGKLSPNLHGTGSEDFYQSSYYFSGGKFNLSAAGLTNLISTPEGRRIYTPYRLFFGDYINFESFADLGIEHGGTNEDINGANSCDNENGKFCNGDYSSITFYYAIDTPLLIKTDELNVGDSSSESNHGYAIQGQTRTGDLNLYYPGYDLDDSSLHKKYADGGRYFSANSSFNISINRDNNGVVLRRRLDYAVVNHEAEVYVDGKFAGVWYNGGVHDIFSPSNEIRWLDSDFDIPPSFTWGKNKINIVIKNKGNEWSEFYYWVYSRKRMSDN